MKILVAEDDAVSRTILKRAVERLGHECLAAEDGGKAWEIYRENPDVNVIISDWMMPTMDGLELCRRVREDGRDGGVPDGRPGGHARGYTYFIFLTALGDRDHLLQGLEAGADDYLSKPLDRDELGMRLISAGRVNELHGRLALQNERLEELNRRLFEQSREDPLTSLGNRLRLREDLELVQARAERYGHSYCVILCDVDHFKNYNDRYGHLAGDEVLERLADTIRETLRSGDAAYRYGGEEFLAILPEQSLASGAQAAERLRQRVEAQGIPHNAKDPPVVTVSAGVAALHAGEGKSADDLLREADEALYRAKEGGRNAVAVYGAQDGRETAQSSSTDTP